MKSAKKGIKREERGYNIDVLMSSKIRIDDAIGMFESDSSGKVLKVKKSGNGAIIPFLKRFIDKKVVVFVVNGQE